MDLRLIDITKYVSEALPERTFYVMMKKHGDLVLSKVTSNPAKAVFRRLCGWKVYCKIRDGQMIL